MVVQLFGLQDVHLIVHSEEVAELGDIPEGSQGGVWLILFDSAAIVQIKADCVAADAGARVSHQNWASSQLKPAVLSETLRPVNHDIRSELLRGDEEVFETIWVSVFCPLRQLIH